ncbi:hypothetical protein [Neorhizobium sp. JUb45]|uniref:hypothetical protein n=1 Tax=Neorhizobium sp. JUb45 TaxID=2485113 RepID=UPI001044F248|nr:hypothetical protein [Neorhizobium sp. JUb45]TCR01081.1 hypothetical protein EDF70_10586 [Neorhizobium sp. JUb45]
MMEALPSIHVLSDCQNERERANWLLTAPPDLLSSCEMTIRRVLKGTAFLDGLSYLDIETAAHRRDRRPDGRYFQSMQLKAARGVMYRIALGLPPVW